MSEETTVTALLLRLMQDVNEIKADIAYIKAKMPAVDQAHKALYGNNGQAGLLAQVSEHEVRLTDHGKVHLAANDAMEKRNSEQRTRVTLLTVAAVGSLLAFTLNLVYSLVTK